MSTRTITGVPRGVWENPRLCPDLSMLFPTFSEEAFGVGSSEISCPRSTIDRPRHFQTSNWTNRSHFSINQNHPRHLWPNFKKSKIFIFFEIGQVTVTPRGSIGNINLGLNRPKSRDTIWIYYFGPTDGIIKCQRWPSLTQGPDFSKSIILTFFEIGQVTMTPRGSIGNINLGLNRPKLRDTIWKYYSGPKDSIIKCQRWNRLSIGAELFLSLYRVKAKGSVGWSSANVSIGSCPRSSLINIRQSQSHPNINLGQ